MGPFEYFIIVCLFVGVAITSQPKQIAIILVLFCAAIGNFINVHGQFWGESFVSLFPAFKLSDPECISDDMLVLLQVMFAFILTFFSLFVHKPQDRSFFKLMSAFLIIEAALLPLYQYDIIIKEETYMLAYHITALTQVAIVFWYSNGTWNIITAIRGHLRGTKSNRVDMGVSP